MPSPRRSLLAGLGIVLAVATACSPAGVSGTGLRVGASVPGTPAPHAVQFEDCTSRLLALGAPVPKALQGTVRFGCGQFDVPLDYLHPERATISLALVRIHTTLNTTTPVQSLLLNPGGPGGSGIGFGLSIFSMLPTSVTRKYDIIAFDPRGVGQSSPVHCLSDSQKDRFTALSPDLTTAAGARQSAALARQYSRACAASVGPSVRYYDTVDTARDMDQIRQGVGDDRMNYLGFSYGTELGWTYAHLFPKQVRTFVLDGAVDPTQVNVQNSVVQLRGFSSAFGQFSQWCRKAPVCAELGNPASAAGRIFATSRRVPLATGTDRRLTESLASTGVIEALYSRSDWPRLASALNSAVKGDGSGLLALADRYDQRSADGSYTNLTDANSVINCNDQAKPTKPVTIARVLATARSLARRFPLFGADAAGSLFGCLGWQPHRTPLPPASAATRSTVLVVGNLHDPATPYAGAQHLAAELGHARLLSWNGEGHTSYLNGSRCVNGYVNAYLADGALPPVGKVCPAK